MKPSHYARNPVFHPISLASPRYMQTLVTETAAGIGVAIAPLLYE
ncbi:hypothetical protein EV695_2205 [Cocleimonas flava]|uniref:Uncharacterized protein n=1 Tax=Cocleimonas flava TaxID=634765 RepID=A0A4R1F4V1_9GAMM|nr:hypothetical protein EV695_2205 [Cocleimonas flava]